MRKRYPHITDEAFVKEWQRGENVKDIAAKLGMTYMNVTSRASRLRKAGVNLKKRFPVFGPRKIVNVRALNRIAKEAALS